MQAFTKDYKRIGEKILIGERTKAGEFMKVILMELRKPNVDFLKIDSMGVGIIIKFEEIVPNPTFE